MYHNLDVGRPSAVNTLKEDDRSLARLSLTLTQLYSGSYNDCPHPTSLPDSASHLIILTLESASLTRAPVLSTCTPR